MDHKPEQTVKSRLKNPYSTMAMALLAASMGFFIHLYTALSAEGSNSTTSAALVDPEPRFITANFGVLVASRDKGHTQTDDFCIVHYNEQNLPSHKNESQFFSLSNYVNHSDSHHDNPCSTDGKFGFIHEKEDGSVILASYDVTGNCSISRAVKKVQEEQENVRGLIFVLPKGYPSSSVRVVSGASSNPKFIIAVMNDRSYQAMMQFAAAGPLEIKVFGPPSTPTSGSRFDLSLVVIWFIATITVILGSWWSGHVRHQLFMKRRCESLTLAEPEDAPLEGKGKKKIEEEPYLNVTPTNVAVFVVCMGVMLCSLYFFYKYLVYFIIGLFVMATILSFYVCCDSLAKHFLPQSWTSFKVPLMFCCSKKESNIHQAIILITAIAISTTWFFNRKESWAWILQDILGVFFSINMLRTIRLPSFKIVTVLLSLLFFYDIFFVFLTPYITSSGDSIMVEVATGGSSSFDNSSTAVNDDSSYNQRETLPMVITVPHLSIIRFNMSDPLEVCYKQMRLHSYSLLGFGDVLVPGLLVSYCHSFDLIHNIRFRLYFIVSCISYGIGLIVTFVGLYLMEGMAQPALLYLVPFTLIPPIVISCLRKEFLKLWRGPGDGTMDTKRSNTASTSGQFSDQD